LLLLAIKLSWNDARWVKLGKHPGKVCAPMSDDRASFVDTAKQRHADRLIEFWLRALFALILAFALIALYYVVHHK
jgi:hypothetical protein